MIKGSDGKTKKVSEGNKKIGDETREIKTDYDTTDQEENTEKETENYGGVQFTWSAKVCSFWTFSH